MRDPHGRGALGPLVVAGWLLGITESMVALKRQPERIAPVLDVLTDTIIAWLRGQADAAGGVEGILLLDDIPRLLSCSTRWQRPTWRASSRRSAGWCGCITTTRPAPTCCPALGALPFEVFNFSHETEIASSPGGHASATNAAWGTCRRWPVMTQRHARRGDRLGQGVYREYQRPRADPVGGGGVSPGTPAANIDALVAAVRDT